jgi:predicted CXXCH cytochrome family protein
MRLSVAKKSEAICADCHRRFWTPEVGPGHKQAANIIHSVASNEFAEKPSEFCLVCHDADRNPHAIANTFHKLSRFYTTASHPFGVRIEPGYQRPNSDLKIQDRISPEIVIIDDKIECLTCHSLVSTNKFKLVMTIEDGLCTACHEMPNDAKLAAISSFSP